MGRDFVDLKDGDRLEPFHINIVYKELRRWRKLKGSQRVQIVGASDGDSIPQIVVVSHPLGHIGVASGTITARVNSTIGTGVVEIKQVSGNSLETAQTSNLTVFNVDSVSIASGKYVWAQRDAFGDWYVSPLEC
jgi:hypothetical protein